MNNPETTSADQTPDLVAITRAIRFALVCIVLCLSYLNVWSALSISKFGQVFADMLGGKPLPAITTFVVQSPTLFLLLSLAIPIAAIATLFARGVVRPFYVLGVLALSSIAFLVVLFHALSAPLGQIISGMSAIPQ
jgi:hypothetical protein